MTSLRIYRLKHLSLVLDLLPLYRTVDGLPPSLVSKRCVAASRDGRVQLMSSLSGTSPGDSGASNADVETRTVTLLGLYGTFWKHKGKI